MLVVRNISVSSVDVKELLHVWSQLGGVGEGGGGGRWPLPPTHTHPGQFFLSSICIQNVYIEARSVICIFQPGLPEHHLHAFNIHVGLLLGPIANLKTFYSRAWHCW